MDYKKIIKSRRMRLAILRALSFVPDAVMIRLQYRIKTGRKLNLKSPKRFTEKLQWYKLNYKNPLMISCVDKYDVREYVKEKNLEKILLECYGVYDSFEQIPWEKLPNAFVLKDTLGMGGSSVIIVKNKESVDKIKIKNTVNRWLKEKNTIKSGGREWPYYSGKKHRIIIEQYLESEITNGGLIDYKFFCFNGEPHYMYVITDRKVGEKACFGIYDMDFSLQDVYRMDENKPKRRVKKPTEFEHMKNVARKLSEPFPEVRIDLYEVDGQVFFGEMTFWDGSGYMQFEPDEFDFKLGELFVL